MSKRGAATVRGHKVSISRPTILTDQVFGYATIPRNFRGNSSNYRGFHTSPNGYNIQQPLSSFRTPQEVVVDGLVLNRFQRPSSQYGSFCEARNSPMNMDFYRARPSSHHQGNLSPSDSFDMSYYNSNPPALPEYPPTPRRPPPENKSSLLLSKEENQTIFEILGKGRQTLATAVMQLLVPSFNQQGWQKKETGVICLVRDTTKKSYFIQVISLRSKSMVFRQEIYNQFEYQMPAHFFLSFEGDSSTVGINFADPTEAANFREALDSKLEAKRQRRNDREHRRSRIISNTNHQNAPQQQQSFPPVHHEDPHPPLSNGTTISTTYTFPTAIIKLRNKAKNKDKKKLTLRKEDIGNPMDFRHVQHVGWDPNKGFDLNGVDNDLRSFFEKAGISTNELKDEETRNFIYNFIEQNGGIENIKKLPDRPIAPPPPPSSSSSSIISGPPPPVPNRQVSMNQKPAAPPPPPSRPIPPVPMRTNISERTPQINHQSPTNNQNNGPARPPPPSISNHSSPKPTHNTSNGPIPAPPPPPPPMPLAGVPPPPPPPPIMSSGNGEHQVDSVRRKPRAAPPIVDDRSNLMASIQKGVQLKKVEPTEAQPKRSGEGGLADCLNQIQRGIALKPVPQGTKEAPSIDTMDGLAGALARALADRSRAINPDSSSSDDGEEEGAEDDEWD